MKDRNIKDLTEVEEIKKRWQEYTEELWKVCNILQESVTKNTPKKKKCKKAQWLPEKTLQIAEKRSERQKRKGKIYQTECRIPENSRGR